MDDVWKLLTILLAGFAAYIAFQQFRLGREKFKLDLFEKRFAVFDATRKFLSTILTEGNVDMQIVYGEVAAHFWTRVEKQICAVRSKPRGIANPSGRTRSPRGSCV